MDTNTISIIAAVLTVLGTVCGILATSLAPKYPKVAAFCKAVSAILPDILGALNAAQHPPIAAAFEARRK